MTLHRRKCDDLYVYNSNRVILRVRHGPPGSLWQSDLKNQISWESQFFEIHINVSGPLKWGLFTLTSSSRSGMRVTVFHLRLLQAAIASLFNIVAGEWFSFSFFRENKARDSKWSIRSRETFFIVNSAEQELCPVSKSQIIYNCKFFLLNRAEHEIFFPNKYENAKYCWHFHIY